MVVLRVSTGKFTEPKSADDCAETCKLVVEIGAKPSPIVESTIPAFHLTMLDPEFVTLITNDVNWSPDVGVMLALIVTELCVVNDCFAVPVMLVSVFDVIVQLNVYDDAELKQFAVYLM